MANEENFDSLEDNVLLQALEDYQLQQDVGAISSSQQADAGASCAATVVDTGAQDRSVTDASNPFSVDALSSFAHLLRAKYVNVSDLQAQEWCEQQMVYNINAKFGVVPVGGPVKEVEVTTPAMKAGTKIHEQKDLEVNSYIRVKVGTREDSWALKLLNTVNSIRSLNLLGIPCIREVPIFGMPYDHGVLVMGIIDELRMNEHDQLELVEVKTRFNPHKAPGKAQVRTHHLQIMVYKQLVDDLVSGALDITEVLAKMRLKPEQVLSDNVIEYAKSVDIHGSTLCEVMIASLDQFRFLPKVELLVVEYYPQDGDGKRILSVDRVEFKEEWLKKRLANHLSFWKQEKEPGGVDIEELWKCNMCRFVDGCHWRQKMNEECLKKHKETSK